MPLFMNVRWVPLYVVYLQLHFGVQSGSFRFADTARDFLRSSESYRLRSTWWPIKFPKAFLWRDKARGIVSRFLSNHCKVQKLDWNVINFIAWAILFLPPLRFSKGWHSNFIVSLLASKYYLKQYLRQFPLLLPHQTNLSLLLLLLFSRIFADFIRGLSFNLIFLYSSLSFRFYKSCQKAQK